MPVSPTALGLRGDRLRPDAQCEPPLPHPPADGVGAGPPGDCQQPGAPAGVPPERGERAPGAHVGVLGRVVGVFRPHQVRRQPPNLPLALSDRGGERKPVPVRAASSRRVSSSTAATIPAGTATRSIGDYPGMDCELIREAISARLDGESPGVAPEIVDGHVATCAECRAFAEGAGALHRAVRVAPAPPVPDLSAGILAAIGPTPAPDATRSHERGLRVALAILGVVQLGVAIPALLGADGGVDTHSARHLGSFSIALAVGFLFAAWRPARVPGLLPVVAALVACVLGTSLLDVIGGRTDGRERGQPRDRDRRVGGRLAPRARPSPATIPDGDRVRVW